MNIPKFDSTLLENHMNSIKLALHRKQFIDMNCRECTIIIRNFLVYAQHVEPDDEGVESRWDNIIGRIYDIHVEDGVVDDVIYHKGEMVGTLVDVEKRNIRNKIVELEEEITKLRSLL